LRFYVGAANLEDDGGYAARVLAEQRHLLKVAAGQFVPLTAPNFAVSAAPAGHPASWPLAPAKDATELGAVAPAAVKPDARNGERPTSLASAG
jgi:hypothetical protein